ncbi:MAG: hypothetical protein KA191_02930 [Verrucomicrobia bacterium]|jgi:hypothetical protein|nr:hypothetical protein [Verrucomicrobiota bacterium]OQC66133.1 MAG: Bacterial type II secretion system protein G [Verrucomicrobia bacterium ADurb.Bin006]MDI9380245.1 hypothetical protein [Verrucomicrobiota bacterium]NMD21805.1 hypothetical protein [Verrucomicrobiota bacterium]HNV00595.1 hypothetical protein [Verrucomicrobiota bacterium]
MKTMFSALLIALFVLTACGRKDSSSASGQTDAGAGGNPLTAPADYLGAIGQAQKHSLKTVDLASVTKAIQMFRTEEDRFPSDLKELVKEGYLPALPQLPAGMAYQYDANTGQVKAVRQQP